MRKAKKETTELIHLIEQTWSETKKGSCIRTTEQAEVVAAINGTLYFLEMFDELRGENHKTYFTKRHLSLRNNMSQTQLSNEYCVCRDSVSTYCAMYLKIFERNLSAIKGLTAERSAETQKFLEELNRSAVQNRKKHPILQK